MGGSTILVTAVCGDIGSSVVRAVRSSAVRIVGCDVKDHPPFGEALDGFHVAPAASDVGAYMAFLKEVIVREDVGFLLPVSEPEIETVSSWREELEALGVRLVLNNRRIVETFLDKLDTVRYLDGLGIRVPKTCLLSGYTGAGEFPLIAKRRRGCGSKAVWRIEDAADLEHIRAKGCADSTVVQEYVGSEEEEYTTAVFSDGRHVSAISFRRKLGFGGLSVDAVLADDPFLDCLATRIAGATGLVGSINIQSRRVGDEFVPFEINPRISSTVLFRKHFGFDDAVWWIDVLSGRGYSYERRYRSGRAVRVLTERYCDMEGV